MDIYIEIGDENQKDQIKKELLLFEKLIQDINIFEKKQTVDSIIVPTDFALQVNKLGNKPGYKSIRGTVKSMAIVLNTKNGKSIVVTPELFLNEKFDRQGRFFILLHELVHIAHKERLPRIPEGDNTHNFYLSWLYTLYDEYIADRIAYTIIDQIFDPTGKWADFVREVILGFLGVVKLPDLYDFIKSEIRSFHSHKEVNLFLERTQESAENISVLSVHAFSVFHQYPEILDDIPFNNLYFVNENTLALMDYLKEKYEIRATDLDDGVALMRDYMKNFGVLFEDRPLGRYCYVIDL